MVDPVSMYLVLSAFSCQKVSLIFGYLHCSVSATGASQVPIVIYLPWLIPKQNSNKHISEREIPPSIANQISVQSIRKL